ncbi:hypothetical protein AB0B78_31935 [Streptomyces sp. NPDC040724]
MKIVKVALGVLIAFAFSVALVGGGASPSPVESTGSLTDTATVLIDWP